MPRIPKTSKKSMTTSKTFIKAGIDSSSASNASQRIYHGFNAYRKMMTLKEKNLPSFLETALKGLSALRALKQTIKDRSLLKSASRIQVKKENITIIKSSLFQLSLMYL